MEINNTGLKCFSCPVNLSITPVMGHPKVFAHSAIGACNSKRFSKVIGPCHMRRRSHLLQGLYKVIPFYFSLFNAYLFCFMQNFMFYFIKNIREFNHNRQGIKLFLTSFIQRLSLAVQSDFEPTGRA